MTGIDQEAVLVRSYRALLQLARDPQWRARLTGQFSEVDSPGVVFVRSDEVGRLRSRVETLFGRYTKLGEAPMSLLIFDEWSGKSTNHGFPYEEDQLSYSGLTFTPAEIASETEPWVVTCQAVLKRKELRQKHEVRGMGSGEGCSAVGP